MPTNATTSPPPPDLSITAVDRLWRIGDVAQFLNRCENTVRALADEPDAPGTVIEDGRGRLWDPRDWWAWAAARAAANQAARKTTAATSRKRGKSVGAEIYA